MQKKDVGISINPIIRQKDEQIEKLQRAVTQLQHEKRRSDFLSQFMDFLSKNYSFDKLLLETTLFFRQEFKSTYAAIFLYNKDKYQFKYQFGTGYKPALMPTIDESGSVMGETLHTNDMVIVEDMKERYFMIDLEQNPPEYNVVCVPIFTEQKVFVLRIANIPQDNTIIALTPVLKSAIIALAKSLDHISQISVNAKALKGVSVSLSISQLLKKTLDRRYILRKTFEKVRVNFQDSKHFLIIVTSDGYRTVDKSDSAIYLGGNPSAHNVYMKNLFSHYPGGDGYIENIHKEPRWSWPDMRFFSINMAPIHLEGKLLGAIVSISEGTSFPQITRVMLGLFTDQLSKTIDRAHYFQKQEEYASLDGLTKLYNRRVFDEVIKAEVAVAIRYRRPLSIIMFDIDFFKKFNDTYGHSTGDEVLQLVAKTVQSTVRESDRAFRYGGEEFIIICPETTSKNAGLLAERLRERIEFTKTSGNLRVTISLGVTEYTATDSVAIFSKRVDDLLYESKEGGRNMVTTG